MKISSKLMFGLISCVFLSQIVQAKNEKINQQIVPTTSDKYEKELSFTLSNYLRDIKFANGSQVIITRAMDQYENELAKIDQKYPDQVKMEAQEHALQMAAQKAKWHNFDVANKALRAKYAKELEPFWTAERELAQASFNKNTEHDLNLRKKARSVYEAAMQSLNFEYRDELAKFNAEQQALFKVYNI